MTVMETHPKKSVLITGCSEGGIGAALALAFQKTGKYHVFATARNTSKLPSELSTDVENVTILTLDVTSKESIEKAVQEVSAKTDGRLDVLINNCGVALLGQPTVDTDIEVAKKMFDVNFFGVMAMVQAFMPLLVMAKGMIVNNSSLMGEKWMMYSAGYGASKSALNLYSETLRLEIAPLGVRVLILATGQVATNVMTNQLPISIPSTSLFTTIGTFLRSIPDETAKAGGMPPAEYASRVLRAVERGRSGKVWVGAMAPVIKAIGWWMPGFLWDQMNLSRNPGREKLVVAAEEWRGSVKVNGEVVAEKEGEGVVF